MEKPLHEKTRYDREVDPAVIARRKALFEKYVTPFYNMIYHLVRQYSNSWENVEENYTIVLTTLFRGIETYNPEREIRTWLHICTKRQVFELEEKRARYLESRDYKQNVYALADVADDYDMAAEQDMNVDNYRQFYGDDVLAALDSLNPIHRDALLLQEAGYSLKEIAEIERKKGTLESGNIDTVKSRLFLARQKLKKMLTRDGIRKTDKTN